MVDKKLLLNVLNSNSQALKENINHDEFLKNYESIISIRIIQRLVNLLLGGEVDVKEHEIKSDKENEKPKDLNTENNGE